MANLTTTISISATDSASDTFRKVASSVGALERRLAGAFTGVKSSFGKLRNSIGGLGSVLATSFVAPMVNGLRSVGTEISKVDAAMARLRYGAGTPGGLLGDLDGSRYEESIARLRKTGLFDNVGAIDVLDKASRAGLTPQQAEAIAPTAGLFAQNAGLESGKAMEDLLAVMKQTFRPDEISTPADLKKAMDFTASVILKAANDSRLDPKDFLEGFKNSNAANIAALGRNATIEQRRKRLAETAGLTGVIGDAGFTGGEVGRGLRTGVLRTVALPASARRGLADLDVDLRPAFEIKEGALSADALKKKLARVLPKLSLSDITDGFSGAKDDATKLDNLQKNLVKKFKLSPQDATTVQNQITEIFNNSISGIDTIKLFETLEKKGVPFGTLEKIFGKEQFSKLNAIRSDAIKKAMGSAADGTGIYGEIANLEAANGKGILESTKATFEQTLKFTQNKVKGSFQTAGYALFKTVSDDVRGLGFSFEAVADSVTGFARSFPNLTRDVIRSTAAFGAAAVGAMALGTAIRVVGFTLAPFAAAIGLVGRAVAGLGGVAMMAARLNSLLLLGTMAVGAAALAKGLGSAVQPLRQLGEVVSPVWEQVKGLVSSLSSGNTAQARVQMELLRESLSKVGGQLRDIAGQSLKSFFDGMGAGGQFAVAAGGLALIATRSRKAMAALMGVGRAILAVAAVGPAVRALAAAPMALRAISAAAAGAAAGFAPVAVGIAVVAGAAVALACNWDVASADMQAAWKSAGEGAGHFGDAVSKVMSGDMGGALDSGLKGLRSFGSAALWALSGLGKAISAEVKTWTGLDLGEVFAPLSAKLAEISPAAKGLWDSFKGMTDAVARLLGFKVEGDGGGIGKLVSWLTGAGIQVAASSWQIIATSIVGAMTAVQNAFQFIEDLATKPLSVAFENAITRSFENIKRVALGLADALDRVAAWFGRDTLKNQLAKEAGQPTDGSMSYLDSLLGKGTSARLEKATQIDEPMMTRIVDGRPVRVPVASMIETPKVPAVPVPVIPPAPQLPGLPASARPIPAYQSEGAPKVMPMEGMRGLTAADLSSVVLKTQSTTPVFAQLEGSSTLNVNLAVKGPAEVVSTSTQSSGPVKPYLNTGSSGAGSGASVY